MQKKAHETFVSTSTLTAQYGVSRFQFFISNEFGLLLIIAIFAFTFALASPRFLSPFSLFNLGRDSALNILIGFSMMTVIVTGGLNLALGAIGVATAMFCGWTIESHLLLWPLALLGSLAFGAFLGFLNGWAVVKTGLHSFIITLATMSIFFGVMIFLTHAEAFRDLPDVFSTFGRTRVFGFVSPFIVITLATAAILACLYNYTLTGREMLAAGAAPAAANLSGIRVGKTIVLCHILSGVLAGVAGLMLMARNGAAIPSMAGQLGQDWLLPAFLGPVLGGTLLQGGKVSVLGTVLGAFLVTMLTNGLLMLQIGAFWVQSFLGLMLLMTVILDKARRSYLSRRNLA